MTAARLFFACDGSRVGVPLDGWPAALSFVVPPSASAPQREPAVHRWSNSYGLPLAGAFQGRRLGALFRWGPDIWLWPTSLCVKGDQQAIAYPGDAVGWRSCAWLREGEAQRVCVMDSAQRLLCMDQSSPAAPASLQVLSEGVVGFTALNLGAVVYLKYQRGWVSVHRVWTTGMSHGSPVEYRAPEATAVVFGRRSCAVRGPQLSQRWQISSWQQGHDRTVRWLLEVAANVLVLGLLWPSLARPGLVVLERDALHLYTAEEPPLLLYTAPAPVTSCVMCPNTGLVVMLTQRRQLIVVEARTGLVRLDVIGLPEEVVCE